MAHDARSLEEIKRDTERARAGLTQTVDELRTTVSETASDLRERMSPGAISAEVSDYFKTRGEALLDTVSEAARKNPVQAVAVGAALAYPLLKLVRAIPAPVLMVGAGLFLAGSKTGQAVTQKASDAAVDFAGEVERRTRDFRADAADSAAAAGQYASDTLHAASHTASSRAAQFREAAASSAAELKKNADEFGKTVSSNVDDLRRKASAAGEAFATQASDVAQKGAGLSDTVSGAIKDTAATVRDTATDAAGRLRDTISASADAGKEAAARVRDRAADLGDRTGKSFVEAVGQNPLLVAGIGLVVGGLIASAIPRFRLESDLLGGAGGELKNRARDAVAGGIQSVKEAASAAYEGAARSAKDEGLSPDAVVGTVTDIGQRARKTAEAAVSPFETPSQNKH